MAVKDNKGQAKVKAKGTHSKAGIVKSRRAAVGSWKEARKARKNSKQQQKAASSVGTASGAGVASSSGAAGSLGDGDLRVLLLGEGDFGFAAALAMDWGECPQLTATTLGSESATLALKGDVEDNVEAVKAFGGTVCFKVDATALHASELVMARAGKRGYDRIVFNFPASELKTTSSQQAVEANQGLLRGMLKSILSNRLLKGSAAGELHLTMRPSDAAEWKLVDISRIAGLRMRSTAPFDAARYQGYEATGGVDGAVTYILIEPPPKIDPEEEKAKKIAALAKAHPELRIGPTGQTYKEAWKQRHGKAKR